MDEDLRELEELTGELSEADFVEGQFTPWDKVGAMMVGPKGIKIGKNDGYPAPACEKPKELAESKGKVQEQPPANPPVNPTKMAEPVVEKPAEKKPEEEDEEDEDIKKLTASLSELVKKVESLELSLKSKDAEIQKLKAPAPRKSSDNAADMSRPAVKYSNMSFGEAVLAAEKMKRGY